MKLIRVHIISAETCGGLLDDLDIWFRSPTTEHQNFNPLCLVGPNGSGKSQFLQVLVEIFQSIFHTYDKDRERIEGNRDLLFEIEYLIRPNGMNESIHVRISRQPFGRQRPIIVIEKNQLGEWINCDISDQSTINLLPSKIIGYTSGNNETLSLPFLISRTGYADEVGKTALTANEHHVLDTRLMLIDYGTHLEVLVANLLLGSTEQRAYLLNHAELVDLHSFRCIIQLNHSAAPPKGVQLTSELKLYIENLRRCATCHTYDEKTQTYIFDYWVNEQTKIAFHTYWKDAFTLYSALHKLAMLNDLAISKKARNRFRADTKTRRFASRLAEPQDEDKVFRFESVRFMPRTGDEEVDYVALSDGEHQLSQILGVFSMLYLENVLFILDEPESHFNPQWRVQFTSKIQAVPTLNGTRKKESRVAEQECLLTTHAPFVPSDIQRENVFIFSKQEGKITYRHPDIETYGTTFDTILEECFDISPPISKIPLDEIKDLTHSSDRKEVREGIARLGPSVQKALLIDHLQQITKREQ